MATTQRGSQARARAWTLASGLSGCPVRTWHACWLTVSALVSNKRVSASAPIAATTPVLAAASMTLNSQRAIAVKLCSITYGSHDMQAVSDHVMIRRASPSIEHGTACVQFGGVEAVYVGLPITACTVSLWCVRAPGCTR